jgi:hypothetical protein
MSIDSDEERVRHWQLIQTPLGEDWSGRTRYAAAMYFFHTGDLTAEELEVYRICSRLDSEDPLKILSDRRIGKNWIKHFTA